MLAQQNNPLPEERQKGRLKLLIKIFRIIFCVFAQQEGLKMEFSKIKMLQRPTYLSNWSAMPSRPVTGGVVRSSVLITTDDSDDIDSDESARFMVVKLGVDSLLSKSGCAPWSALFNDGCLHSCADLLLALTIDELLELARIIENCSR